jgi:ATP-dependent Clp protease adaptor protein ClpS
MAQAMPSTQTQTGTQTRDQTDNPGPWNVVLLDDADHSYEYVIKMIQELFAASPERAFEVAAKVDKDGRAVCLTTHKEHAELKVEQIHSFGPDPTDPRCQGSMSAVMEPAFADGDGDEDGASGGASGGAR